VITTPVPTNDPTLSPVTFAPTLCDGRLIFIVTVDDETFCTNGNCYETDNGEDYFDNFDDCCAKLVVDGNIDADDKCKREDICNPTEEPTEAPTAPAPKPIPVSLSLCLPLFIHHQLFSP
jgi:hypothetical protein